MMKRGFRFCLVVGLASWLGISSGLAAEVPVNPLMAYEEAVLGIIPQAATERAACEAMLAAGVKSGMWTEEEQRAGEDWLTRVFSDPEQEAPVAKPISPGRAWSNLVALATRPTDPTAATQPVFSWLKARFTILEATRKKLLEAMCRTAIDQAESAWLSAKTATDLDAAIRGLAETKAVLDFKWGQLITARNQGLSYTETFAKWPELAEGVWDFRDCWSIIASPQPLVLPDPVDDPAAFAVARRKWLGLTTGPVSPQSFLKRPAVARRFAELDDRFRAEFAQILEFLNAAILREAPAAEFEKEFGRLQRHVITANAADRMVRPSPPQSPFDPTSDTPPDYRTRLSNRQPGLPGPPMPGAPTNPELKWTADFAGWLAWRRAVETGNAEKIETARRALLTKVREFKPRVAEYLSQRLAPPTKPPPSPSRTLRLNANIPQTAVIADMVAALRQRTADDRAVALDPAVSKLITMWLDFDRGDTTSTSTEEQSSAVWSQIAAGIHGSAILELRDRAARAVIVRFVPELAGAAELPLLPLLRKALEISVAREDFSAATKILTLDAISSVLFDSDRRAWTETITESKRAVERTSAGDPSARTAWIQLLRTTSSPAAAMVAVHKLKANAAAAR